LIKDVRSKTFYGILDIMFACTVLFQHWKAICDNLRAYVKQDHMHQRWSRINESWIKQTTNSISIM